MNHETRLILSVEPRRSSRRRFLDAMSGQSHVRMVSVPREPGRGADEEQSIRLAAVVHAREMLAADGFVLSRSDEERAQRFVDSEADRVEIVGERSG